MENKEILKVSSTTAPGSLASTIVRSLDDGKEVAMRGIGAACVNTAVKATDIANKFLEQDEKGYEVLIKPRKIDLEVDGTERTGIEMDVVVWKG